ncbi:MAG: hypothetical protein PHY59_03665 [Methanobacterium sp.]|nr:hypothetical protein [Methanobacterium sp.]
MKLRKPKENKRINREMLSEISDKPEELEKTLEQLIYSTLRIKDIITNAIPIIVEKLVTKQPKTTKRSLNKVNKLR